MKNFNFWLTEAEQTLAKIRVEPDDPNVSKSKQYIQVCNAYIFIV